MPALNNPRHEAFCQALAKGSSASQAYREAGYKDNRGNATALKQTQNISKRLAELMAERTAIHEQATAEAVERQAVTIESLIIEAGEIQAAANKAGQHAAAVSALTAKAKLAGLWVDRSDTRNTHEIKHEDALGELA